MNVDAIYDIPGLGGMLHNLVQAIQQQHLQYMMPEVCVSLLLVGGLLQLSCIDHDTERQHNWGYWMAVVGCVLALVCLGMIAWTFPNLPSGEMEVWNHMYRADLFCLVVRFLLVIGTLLVMMFSRQYIRENTAIPGEFYLLLLGALLGGMILAGATDLVLLFVGLETLSISSYILVGYLRGNALSAEAGLKYLVYGGVATAILLFGFSLLYGLSGGATTYRAIQSGNYDESMALVTAIMTVMILGGFCFKLSAAPFHMWAPDVYEGAPTPVTAFLAVVSKTAAFAMTIRFFHTVMSGVPGWDLLLAVLAVLSMVVGNVIALTQTNIKRLLAYSTVAHVGYLLLGLVIMSDDGLSSLLYYLMAYMFMNLGAFAVVVRVQNLTGRDDIAAYAGLIRSNPGLTLTLTLMLLSLAGIPITAGFFGKFFLFWAVANAGPEYLWLVIVALLTSTISLYYYLNIIRLMVISEPSDAVQALQAKPPAQLTMGFASVLAICLAATLLMGIFAGPFLALSQDTLRHAGGLSSQVPVPAYSSQVSLAR